LVNLAAKYGKAGTFSNGDSDGTGIVNMVDLVNLARYYGSTFPLAAVGAAEWAVPAAGASASLVSATEESQPAVVGSSEQAGTADALTGLSAPGVVMADVVASAESVIPPAVWETDDGTATRQFATVDLVANEPAEIAMIQPSRGNSLAFARADILDSSPVLTSRVDVLDEYAAAVRATRSRPAVKPFDRMVLVPDLDAGVPDLLAALRL
jgi:hypothetical protein